MPRTHRIEFPGALVHIMSRGLDGLDIFRGDEDREFFLSRLSSELGRTGYTCHAWALMSNHYHLLLRATDLPMSKIMRPLNGSYGHWFNKKYGRRGYLYQDRFKSVLCQDQEYARQLIRYIHLNPIRAGQVRDLGELRRWKWCGHGYLLGTPGASGAGFQQRDEALRRFGATRTTGIKKYLEFLREGMVGRDAAEAGALPEEYFTELSVAQKGFPAIIGNPQFVRQAMEKNRERCCLVRRLQEDPEALERLAEEICRKHAISREELQRQGRNDPRSRARKEFCVRAHTQFHASTSTIARYLDLTLPPVSIMLRTWEIAKARAK